MKKNFKIMGMTPEEYRRKKYQKVVEAIMKVNGWNKDEIEFKD